jgi:hypothetical protein
MMIIFGFWNSVCGIGKSLQRPLVIPVVLASHLFRLEPVFPLLYLCSMVDLIFLIKVAAYENVDGYWVTAFMQKIKSNHVQSYYRSNTKGDYIYMYIVYATKYSYYWLSNRQDN